MSTNLVHLAEKRNFNLRWSACASEKAAILDLADLLNFVQKAIF
jgi:hypothetical protein